MDPGRRGTVMKGRHRGGRAHHSLQLTSKIRSRWREWERVQQIPGKPEGGAVEEVSRRAQGILPDGRPHAQKHIGQVVEPGSGTTRRRPGHQSLHKDPVLTFYEAITLGVIGGRLTALNTEEGGKLRPEGARELAAPCLLYTSPSPRDGLLSRMPSSA